jgi:hypothetical protein
VRPHELIPDLIEDAMPCLQGRPHFGPSAELLINQVCASGEVAAQGEDGVR